MGDCKHISGKIKLLNQLILRDKGIKFWAKEAREIQNECGLFLKEHGAQSDIGIKITQIRNGANNIISYTGESGGYAFDPVNIEKIQQIIMAMFVLINEVARILKQEVDEIL